MDSEIKDVIIIGGGPTGINCGIACKKAGLKYIILEKGVLVNSLYNFPFNMTFFSTSKKLEIGDVPFISHNDKPTRSEALEYYRRILEAYNLNIELGIKVKDLRKEKDIFLVNTNKETLKSKHIILATGFYDTPRKLEIPGEELAKVKHYYDDVHLYIRKNIVVVGAANSACDVALECWQKGANVTMVIRDKSLYHKVKYWILPNIENRIKEGSIKAYFQSKLTEIHEETVLIDTPKGVIELDNDYVLAMTGYKPHMDWFISMGIELSEDKREPVIDTETMETNMVGIYIAGVAASGLNTSTYFIENTRDHADKIVNHIISKK